MKADLHCHSIYSDGLLTPTEVVLRAKNNGVTHLALTDHDSIDGLSEFQVASKKEGITPINGIELTTKYNDKGELKEVHILGLFKFNKLSKSFTEYLEYQFNNRLERGINMLKLINKEYGYKIDIDEFKNTKSTVTRKNMLEHLCKHNNIAREQLIISTSKNSKAYIPSSAISTKEGIELLKNENMVTILAHPCLINNNDIVLDIVKNMNVDGLEAKYPYVKNNESYFKQLAKDNNIFISAGNDFHEINENTNKHADIGSVFLNEEEFNIIDNILNR